MIIKKFATLFDLDTPVKPECDTLGKNASAGRSMVEMLGVLAIIGVLSVGAIAGYSKAMMKYKLNKHAEQMNTIINAVARHAHSFDNLSKGTYLTDIFIKMGEIPTEMTKNSSSYIYDIFGQKWLIAINNQTRDIHLSTYAQYGGSSALSLKSDDNLEICKNMFLVAKENHNNISVLYTSSISSDNNRTDVKFYGDALCNSTVKCIKDATIDDIYTLCTKHINQPSNIFFEIIWY